MDAAGLAIGLVGLVWECYKGCKNDSASFYDLHRDNHSSHTTLYLVKRYLPNDCDLGAEDELFLYLILAVLFCACQIPNVIVEASVFFSVCRTAMVGNAISQLDALTDV